MAASNSMNPVLAPAPMGLDPLAGIQPDDTPAIEIEIEEEDPMGSRGRRGLGDQSLQP